MGFTFPVLVDKDGAVSASFAPEGVQPDLARDQVGETKEVAIGITVTDGFHVQANPAANEFLIPLELEWDNDSELDIGEVRYRPGKTFHITGTEESLLTYEGTFAVKVLLRAPGSAKSVTASASGRLRYQACDDRSCRRPETLDFELRANIERPVD